MEYSAVCSSTLKQGLDTLSKEEFDILFLDVNLPDGNGIEAIEIIKEDPLAPEIIIMTGESNPKGAELAIKSRAWDYIQKSSSHNEFQFSLIRALEYRNQKQPKHTKFAIKRESIIGKSRQILNCLEKVSKASNNDVPVLITGETGTGKELFAKAIHENSSRKNHNFVVVDCAALPDHLVESVLFGHVKGAFTSADSDKMGLIKLADKGILFLDEVGELPLNSQKKFLRVLQEKKFRPVGGKKEISSNFKLISATHRNLNKMVEQSQFREDFYFRIASLSIEISPLRDRKSDITSLVEHRLNWKTELYNETAHKISEQFMEYLQAYNWPGNIRELFNSIDHACNDAFNESMLFPKHLPDHIRAFNINNKIAKILPSKSNAENSAPFGRHTLKDYIEEKKHQYITDLMVHTQGDIKTACRLSGLSRGHLYALMKEYDIRNS